MFVFSCENALILMDCILWCFEVIIVWACYIVPFQKGIKFNYCIIAVAFSKWLAQNDTISTINVHEMRSSMLYWECDCQEQYQNTFHREARWNSLFFFLSIGSLKKLFWSVKIDSRMVLLHPLLKVVVIRETAIAA